MSDVSTTKPNASPSKHDWSHFDGMSDADRTAAELADPGAQPLTEENIAQTRRVPQIRVMCRALHLTLTEFADRYQLPLELVQSWNDGTAEPDAASRAYLRVIAREPELVRRALRPGLHDAA